VKKVLKNMGGSLQMTIVVLAIVGALDSAYLAWLKVTGSVATCSNIGDCEAVSQACV
jgi:membrane protein required for beta-lactamase induction